MRSQWKSTILHYIFSTNSHMVVAKICAAVLPDFSINRLKIGSLNPRV